MPTIPSKSGLAERGSSRLWLTVGALAVLAGGLAALTPKLTEETGGEAAARCAQGFRLTPGRPVPGQIGSGGVHVYRISREKGEVLNAVVEQRGVDVTVVLWAPSGRRLLAVDSPNGDHGPEPVFAVAEEKGEHCLEVRSGGGRGAYTAWVDRPRRASPEDWGRATAIRAFGEAEQLRKQGELASAVHAYQKVAKLWQALGDPMQHGITLHRLAQTHQEMGHDALAIEPLLRALPLVEGNLSETSAVLNRLGRSYKTLGRNSEAFECFQKNLEISQRAGYAWGEASARNEIGQVYQVWGELESARSAFQRSLDFWRQVGDQGQEATVLGNLAELDLAVGRLEDSQAKSESALKIRQELHDLAGEADSQRTLGEALAGLGQSKKALQVLKLARSRAGESHNAAQRLWSLEALGVALLRQGSLDAATPLFEQAWDLAQSLRDPHSLAEAAADLAQIAALRGDSTGALAGFERAKSLYEKLGDRGAVAWALAGRAAVEEAAGSLREARADLDAALAIIETLRGKPGTSLSRASFLASRHSYYELAVDVLMRLARRESDPSLERQAFEVSERARARAFLDELGEAGVTVPAGADPELQGRFVALERRLRDLEELLARLSLDDSQDEKVRRASLADQIQAVAEEEGELRERMAKSAPRNAVLLDPRPLDLAAIQGQILDDGTALLVYSLGDTKSYLWLIRKRSLISRDLPSRSVIEAAATDLSRAWSRPGANSEEAEVRATALKLSRLVLGPIAAELGSDRLAIVADGALYSIPFAALPEPGNPRRPLIWDHELVYLPSASILAVLRQTAGRPSPPKTVVALADPVFDFKDERVPEAFRLELSQGPDTPLAEALRSARDLGIGNLERLRYSGQEAKDIVALAPPGTGRLALGFEANRDLVFDPGLRQYRILHFATHAFVDPWRPSLSGILLSTIGRDGRPRNGFLRAYDLYNLSLPVDLVVLSACQTAVGKEVRGEGLMNLARGFQYAGVPRVVASLWKVSDRKTAELMTSFYRHMLVEGLRPAAALQAAQIAMSRDPKVSPYTWASFVLQGEWR